MAIDRGVIEQDLRANIRDWPVTIRYKTRKIQAALQSQADLSQVLDSGLLDDRSLTVIAAKSDFGKNVPEDREQIDLRLSNGSWLALEIVNAPNRYDTADPTLILSLGNPNK